MKPNLYRINARNIGVTYPQSDMPLEWVLNEVGKRSKVLMSKYLIVRERHEDGGYHIHGYFKYERPVNIINPHHLDIKWGEKEYHGKYESVRDPGKWIQYLLKTIKDPGDGNILYSENMGAEIGKLGNYEPYPVRMVSLAREGKVREAMELYEKGAPAQYMKNWMSVEKSLKGLFMRAKGLELKYPLASFNTPPELLGLLNKDPYKTVVLSGGSGSGKTRFLLAYCVESLGVNPLVINNLDGLRFYSGQQVIIMDDVAWPGDILRESLIKLVDSEDSTTLNIKHASVQIPENTRRIISTNTREFVQPKAGGIEVGSPNPYSDEAVQRRIHVYVLGKGESLIKPPSERESLRKTPSEGEE